MRLYAMLHPPEGHATMGRAPVSPAQRGTAPRRGRSYAGTCGRRGTTILDGFGLLAQVPWLSSPNDPSRSATAAATPRKGLRFESPAEVILDQLLHFVRKSTRPLRSG
jgi:hypothetical protein